MGAKVSEMERTLSEREREQAKAGAALSKAREVLRTIEGGLRAAQEELTRREAGEASGSWELRKGWRAAADAVEQAEKKLAEARKLVLEKQESRDAVADEVLELQEKLAQPRLEALRLQVSGLMETLRQKQAEALTVARELVSLHVRAREAAPRRIVAKRAINRYLIVAPKDPVLREAVAARLQITGIPPGFFSYEYYRAMKETGPDGRYELWSGPDGKGQDLTPPAEVEEQRGEGILPPELDAIKDLDLGVLISLNGKPSGKPGRRSFKSPKRLTFYTLEVEMKQAGEEVRT